MWTWIALGAMTVVGLVVVPLLPDSDGEGACPTCGHDCGVSERRAECANVDDNNGWSSDFCRCDDDYHWRSENAA